MIIYYIVECVCLQVAHFGSLPDKFLLFTSYCTSTMQRHTQPSTAISNHSPGKSITCKSAFTQYQIYMCNTVYVVCNA